MSYLKFSFSAYLLFPFNLTVKYLHGRTMTSGLRPGPDTSTLKTSVAANVGPVPNSTKVNATGSIKDFIGRTYCDYNNNLTIN